MMNKYTSNKEGKCPVCGGNYLTYGSMEPDFPDFVSLPYVCEDCGCEGQEYYRLSFGGHSVYNTETDDLEDVDAYLSNRVYTIIDVMENQVYYCDSQIDMGFRLDSVLEQRERLEIPYKVTYYNNGKVVSIRPTSIDFFNKI